MFVLGSKSLANLEGVHPSLRVIVMEAIGISKQDFGVYEGLRSLEKEQENIRTGASKLHSAMDCKHCKQPDGYGHAVDLVPFVDGAYQWDWAKIPPVVIAMQAVAIKRNVKLRWGGVWDKQLNVLSSNIIKEVDDYKVRHIGSDFLDGVHFELIG